MKIALFGAGAWGTALAIAFAGRHEVTLWAREDDVAVKTFRPLIHDLICREFLGD